MELTCALLGATKRLMSSGSSAGSGRSGSAVGVKRDEGEKKEGKEESKCNGNVLPNGTAEAPILMSLDLETPSKVKPGWYYTLVLIVIESLCDTKR